MHTFESYFYNGQFHACYELAKENPSQQHAQQYTNLFEKFGYDEVPSPTPGVLEQGIERSNETYKEQDEVEHIRTIKDEALFTQAITELERIAKEGTDVEKAQSFFTQAQLFLYAHHYDESIHCFLQAVVHQPGNAVYYGFVGQTMQRFNWSPFEVMAYLDHALTLDPENPRWLWNKGLALLQLHQDLQDEAFLGSAIIALEQAQQACRDDQKSLRNAIDTAFEKVKEILTV